MASFGRARSLTFGTEPHGSAGWAARRRKPPTRKLDSALRSTVATRDNWGVPVQLVSEDDSGEVIEARSVVPSSVPEAVTFGPLGKLRTKLLPDCEITIALSGIAVRTLPQGSESSCAESTWTIHAPSMETGAVRLRPLLRIPASPTKGRITRKA